MLLVLVGAPLFGGVVLAAAAALSFVMLGKTPHLGVGALLETLLLRLVGYRPVPCHDRSVSHLRGLPTAQAGCSRRSDQAAAP